MKDFHMVAKFFKNDGLLSFCPPEKRNCTLNFTPRLPTAVNQSLSDCGQQPKLQKILNYPPPLPIFFLKTVISTTDRPTSWF